MRPLTGRALRAPAGNGRNPCIQRGLTLVEMLVALVLSSVIFVSAYQIIANLVQYQVRARVHNESNVDALLLESVISQIIEMGINQYDLFYRTQKSSLFQGEIGSLQLISRAYSERFDLPGYRVYRIFERDDELFVSYRAYDRDYRANRQHELGTGLEVRDLRFAYLENGEWIDEWQDPKSIPELIRVRAQLADDRAIEWIRGTSRR